MLTREEYLEAHTLRCLGWSIAAISRRLGRDRKTVRSYLGGERIAGVRRPPQDEFLRFLPYCRQRLADDAHLRATVLFDEIVELGYPGAYSTFTRALRRHQVRPSCTDCQGDTDGDGTAVPHPAGGEVRFAWLRLPDPPARWGCGGDAHVLVGSLTRSGRCGAVLAENEEFPQLVEAVDLVLRRLGGTANVWRFDRTPAVCSPATGRVAPALARVARYYKAGIRWPSCQCGRSGTAVDDLRISAQHWWRTVGRDTRLQVAQGSLDRLTQGMAVRGPERSAGSVAGEGLFELPATPFPARVRAVRSVTSQGLVSFRGNEYAVAPDLAGAAVEVRWRLDEPYLSIVTPRGAVIARHELAPHWAGRKVIGCQPIVLEHPARDQRAGAGCCTAHAWPSPPSAAALAEADALRGAGAVHGAQPS
ncbi:IS21 family transposase [Kitasatospora sp. NBC_00374]|uniref:Mu transposase domain-containing protein n=1 Tax=Kitasatospora sp. NBC_00374 TaxID=2975964 RepID=UPI00325596DF